MALAKQHFMLGGRSPSRLLGMNPSRGIRGGPGRGGLGVVGGFCRGCGGSAGEVLLVGLRGRTLRKVRIHFCFESVWGPPAGKSERAAEWLSEFGGCDLESEFNSIDNLFKALAV